MRKEALLVIEMLNDFIEAGAPLEVPAATGPVDRLPVGQDHPRPGALALVAHDRADQLAQPVGFDVDVVVQEDQDLRIAPRLRSLVDRGAEAEVPLVDDHFHLGVETVELGGCAVPGGVVDHDDPHALSRVVARREPRQARLQELQPVVAGDHHRDARQLRGRERLAGGDEQRADRGGDGGVSHEAPGDPGGSGGAA